MYEFERARNRRHELGDANLKPVEQLMLAMRFFVGRAGVVLAVNSHFKILETEIQRFPTRLNMSVTTVAVLQESYWQTIMVNLRAMLESNPGSIGIGAIAKLLERGEPRNGFCELLEKASRRVTTEPSERDAFLDYIHRYAAILSTRSVPVPPTAHPLVEKAELVRRTATKRVAHATIDGFKLYGSDMQDVIIAVIVLGEAMNQVMGDAGSEDLLPIEHAALVGGAQLLGLETDTAPHLLNSIRGFMPMWVHSDREFPTVAEMQDLGAARRAARDMGPQSGAG